MSVTIRPATLRDASFVTANLRPMDHREVFCQLAPGTKTHELAYALTLADDTYCAFFKDRPVAIYGVGPINICTLSVWAIGTRDMRRAVPAITRHIMETILPEKIEQGFTSAEARTIEGHHTAHRWMQSLGGEPHGEPFVFGRGGERFILYRWTVGAYRTIREAKQAKTKQGTTRHEP